VPADRERQRIHHAEFEQEQHLAGHAITDLVHGVERRGGGQADRAAERCLRPLLSEPTEETR
jgi:hypothetical protein